MLALCHARPYESSRRAAPSKQLRNKVQVVENDIAAADCMNHLEYLRASSHEPQVDVQRDVGRYRLSN